MPSLRQRGYAIWYPCYHKLVFLGKIRPFEAVTRCSSALSTNMRVYGTSLSGNFVWPVAWQGWRRLHVTQV